MGAALYGEDGYYRSGIPTATRFRTSVTASGTYADGLVRLLSAVDVALGHPDPLDVVDVGAGQGELLLALRARTEPGLRRRLRLSAVEVAERPADLPGDVRWTATVPADITGLVVANEWLDVVPLDVVVRTRTGLAIVHVDPASGRERPGGPPEPEDAAWLREWWPLDAAPVGDRAEVGRPRDEAWAGAVRSLRRGVAVAVDYAHTREERARLAGGTLSGYRAGRQVAPVPDGSCDLTAHVALDACAAAGERAGADATLLTSQREALRALGLDGCRPAPELARRDPAAYVAGLVRAGEAAELTGRGGLGDFGWLVQAVGVPLPLSAPSRAAIPALG